MKAKEFYGIIPPLLSSFTKDGEIYEKGIRNLIKFSLPFVHGYYPIGTYGCGPLMSVDERKRVLEIILSEVNGRVPVVAHVGHPGTQPTLSLQNMRKRLELLEWEPLHLITHLTSPKRISINIL